MVIQNHTGQQYPIALDDIQEFLVRWPITSTSSTASVVEAVGQDLGNNVLTEHVDVFGGRDRTLVAPTYNSLLPNNALVTTIDPGFNRLMSPWDYAGQNMLYGWAYPVPEGSPGFPHACTWSATRSTFAAPAGGSGQQHRDRDPRRGPEPHHARVTRGDITMSTRETTPS